MKMITILPILLLASAASAEIPSTHTAEQETQEMRAARQEQRMHKLGLRLFDNVRDCEYVSDISTPAPFNRIAMTFDDGPEPGATERILAVLKKYDIHAEFFNIGYKAKAHPELVKMVLAQGHLIVGNHSWDHPNFHKLTDADQDSEVEKNDALFSPIYSKPKLFRFPYGNSTCHSIDYVHSLNYKIAGWHVDSCDWGFNPTGSVNSEDADSCEVAPANIHNYVNHVLATVKLHHGGVVLMHEIQPITVRNLDFILGTLKAQGYTFGTLDEPAFQKCLL